MKKTWKAKTIHVYLLINIYAQNAVNITPACNIPIIKPKSLKCAKVRVDYSTSLLSANAIIQNNILDSN